MSLVEGFGCFELCLYGFRELASATIMSPTIIGDEKLKFFDRLYVVTSELKNRKDVL